MPTHCCRSRSPCRSTLATSAGSRGLSRGTPSFSPPYKPSLEFSGLSSSFPYLLLHSSLLQNPTRAPKRRMPFSTAEVARRRSSRTGDLRSSLTTSCCALSPQEPNPPVNWKLPPPRSRTRVFFPVTGHHHPSRRRFLFGGPLSNSPLSEHPLASYYLPLTPICSLVLSRDAAARSTLRRPWSPPPAQLRPPQLSPSTLTFEHASKIIDDQATTSLSEQYKQEQGKHPL